MYSPLNTLSFILRHPLNRAKKGAALRRFIRWQIASRLLPGAVAVPFVDSTRLLVLPGMTGATGNIYCGLPEYQEMGIPPEASIGSVRAMIEVVHAETDA